MFTTYIIIGVIIMGSALLCTGRLKGIIAQCDSVVGVLAVSIGFLTCVLFWPVVIYRVIIRLHDHNHD